MSMAETITIPGFVDLHVHLREPSNNNAETIESGTRAAMLGGFVVVCDMPNNPGQPTWTEERVEEKYSIIRHSAHIPVGIYSGSQPESDNIGELEKMAKRTIGLKLYGAPTTGNERDYEAEDFRPIVEEWHRVVPDKPVMLHAGQENLEDMIDLVAGEAGQHLHVCHVNNTSQVVLVNKAKAADLPVTCGVCPHHLFKTSHDVQTEGWEARMQPPLAHQDEAEALFDKLVRGEIDVIETDHAPHSLEAKEKAEDENPDGIHDKDHTTCFGVPGIEFAAPLMFYQVKRGNISMERVIEVMSTKPAQIIGLRQGLNTDVAWNMERYRITGDEMALSGSGWLPYLGKWAVGRVGTMRIDAKILVRNGRPAAQVSQVFMRNKPLS